MTWVHTCKCKGNLLFFFLEKQVALQPLVPFGLQPVKYIHKVAKVLKEFLLGGMDSNTILDLSIAYARTTDDVLLNT